MTETEAGHVTGEPAAQAETTAVSTPFSQGDALPAPVGRLLVGVLESIAETPQIIRVREQATTMLGPSAGQQILEAGCGGGEVARELATMVGPTGQVTAVDAAQVMIDHAAAKDNDAGVNYRVANVTALPFADGTFDAVRCERVLQHVSDADLAVAELKRVTRPGGRICLIDTDWTSLATDGMPDAIVDGMTGAFMSQAMHHRTMGRTLRRRLVQAGLTGIWAEPITLCFTDLASASAVIPLFDSDLLAETGLLPEELRQPWFDAVDAANSRGELMAVLTLWVVVGTRV
jgi:ubiquinone/menaquinone biosynthesis C-methylase UbiE